MTLRDVPAVRRLLEKPVVVARARELEISAAELARRILAGEHDNILPLGDLLELESAAEQIEAERQREEFENFANALADQFGIRI